MLKIFGLFAVPLGYILRWVCSIVPNYLIAIFLFTLLMKLLLFPLNISSQKGAADRARLAPRLERIQKKYANDRKKMAEKQQELYDKEGVKMTAGCLPQILQMLVLFSIIAVIYKPLTYVERIDAGTPLRPLGEGSVCSWCAARGLCRKDWWSAPQEGDVDDEE